jgi:histidinol phosphatase-like enzyme (inositol monophosphatase family)
MADDLEAEVELARALAEAGRRETLPRCRDGWAAVDNKLEQGFDPVTDADRSCEKAIRRLIEARFPEHGIRGEEFPDRPGSGPLAWSIDPIDGTRAYICGLPTWTTLIALLDDGEPVLGLVDVPRLDELYIGYARTALLIEAGAERPIATSHCRSLAEARLSTTDPTLFEGPEAEGFERLRRAVRLTRFGLDGYGYAALAAGRLDVVAECGLKPHDYNAVVALVRAAGGAVSNWSGGTDLAPGQVVAAANEDLLEQACRMLGGR